MLNQLNQVVDYIENHLTEDLSIETLSREYGDNLYHFSKVFLYLSGYSLSEYIKNRRLSEANKALLAGNSVTDVSLLYGYQSLDGFTRAFKRWSGIVPSEVREQGFSKTMPKLSFLIQVTGGISMECRMVELPAFHFAGVAKRVPMQFEGVNQEIVKLAQSITEEQRTEMHALQNMEPYEIVNVSYDADANFLREEGELTHLIGVLTTRTEISPHLQKVPVKPLTWAVFPNEGPFPSTLQETMAKIYAQWLPVSDYIVIQAPSFSFTKMNQTKEGYAYSEVWIPVQSK